MRFSDAEITADLMDWIRETEQNEIRYVIPYCLGCYGYITKQIWKCIRELEKDGYLTW